MTELTSNGAHEAAAGSSGSGAAGTPPTASLTFAQQAGGQQHFRVL